MGRSRPLRAARPAGLGERAGVAVPTLAALQPVPTLDVACGTGYLTRYLPGRITCLDQSPAMLEVAPTRIPAARLRPKRRASPPFRGPFVRACLHQPLLRPSRGGRPGRLSRRGSPGRSRARHRRLRAPRGRRAGRMAGASPERRLALAGLQALLRAGRARRRARQRRDSLRRPLVRRRSRVTRPERLVPLAPVAPA